MADELDDGLLLDDEFVAHSDDGDAPPMQPERSHMDDATSSKKRKRREQAKAQRRKEQAAETHHIAQKPRDIQADLLVGLQRKAFPKLSALELQELRVPAAAFIESFTFTPERTLENLTPFVRQYVAPHEELQDVAHPWMKEPGRPFLLVLTGNAQRAADLTRALRPLLPGTDRARVDGSSAPMPLTVAKLFARHFKLNEQVSWLQSQATPIAVGTPHRVQALLEHDALHLEHLRCLLVDTSWTDAKQRAILDTPETRDALFALLAEKRVRALFQAPTASCQVLLF